MKLKPETVLSSCRIIEKIGEGATGTVYRAQDEKLGRFVAIKIVGLGKIDALANKRFLEETRALAHLHHPGIVQIYCYGELEGSPYLIMEHLEGRCLKSFLEKARAASAGRLTIDSTSATASTETNETEGSFFLAEPTTAVLNDPAYLENVALLVAALADALFETHASGIVHRDLRPSNIMISKSGQPKILDFGLAQSIGKPELADREPRLDTLKYMAPEQFSDAEDAITQATDIYRLGLILYELATLVHPVPESTFPEMRLAIQQNPTDSPQQLNPHISKGLSDVILKCLSKNPEGRFPSAGELAEALKALDEFDARQPGFWSRTAKSFLSKPTPSRQARPSTLEPGGALFDRFLALQRVSAEQLLQLRKELSGVRREREEKTKIGEVAPLEPIPVAPPRVSTNFVGRQAECSELKTSLCKGEHCVTAIVGPGGFGKTELVAKLLQDVAPEEKIRDASLASVIFLRCLSHTLSLSVLFSEAGRALGRFAEFQATYLSAQPLESKLAFLLRELSRQGHVWIVLDGFEAMLDPDDNIVDLEIKRFLEMALTTTHKVRILLTTRSMPLFTGCHRVKRIELSHGLTPEEAARYLRVEGGEQGLTKVAEETLLALARRVCCIPQALESAVGYLAEQHPNSDLTAQIEREDAFAGFDIGDAKSGILKLIAEQFASQSDDAKLTLFSLSVFRKPMVLTGLRFFMPAIDLGLVLPRLERARLVMRRGATYELSPLVKEYVYGELPDDDLGGDLPAAIKCRLTFNQKALHQRAAEYLRRISKPRGTWRTLSDIDATLEEFHHLCQAGHFARAASAVHAVCTEFLWPKGYNALVISLRTRLIGKLVDPTLEGRNWTGLGLSHVDLGQLDAAMRCHSEALHLCRRGGDLIGETEVLTNIGRVWLEKGDPTRAQGLFEQALTISRQIGHLEFQAKQLMNLGLAFFDLDDIRQGVTCQEQALRIFESAERHDQAALVRSNLGLAYLETGRHAEAQAFFEGKTRAGDPAAQPTAGNHFIQLAWVYAALGDETRAMEFGFQARETAVFGGDEACECRSLCLLGGLYRRSGEFQDALVCFAKALRLAASIGYEKKGRSVALLGLGTIELERGRLREAEKHLQEAAAIGDLSCQGEILTKLALYRLGETRNREAGGALREASEVLEKRLTKTKTLYWSTYCLALVRLAAGQEELALRTYQEALAICASPGAIVPALADLGLLRRIIGHAAVERAFKMLNARLSA